MSKGLKIYACSGVGTGVGNTNYKFTYWKDNTNELTNTKAVNNLLSFINSVNADIIYAEHTEEELINDCNIIDLYVTCLQAAKTYHGTDLQRAGRVIGIMVKEGFFNSQSLDDTERDTNLDSLIDHFYEAMNTGNDYEINSPFVDWFQINVSDYDYVGMTEEQRIATENALSDMNKSVGATDTDNESMIDKFVNSGGYYLYLYFNEEERKKLPYWVKKKIEKQAEVKTYTYGYYEQIKSTRALDQDIRVGVCKTYGHTPEWMIENIKSYTGQDKKGVGIATEIIVAIISAAVTLITTFISALVTIIVSIVQIKYSVPKNVDSGIATDSDLELMMQEEEQKTKTKKYIKYGILGVLAMLIIKKL